MDRRRLALGSALAVALVIQPLMPIAGGEPLDGLDGATLGREPAMTPEQLGDGTVDGLQYADPVEGLSLVSPPEASTSGAAELGYPLLLPPGRGITPELALTYDSGGDNGWVGLGWDLSVGEIAVDTSFGAPHFDAGLESESYTIDGEPLVPNALGETWEQRVRGDREDYTRQVENDYERIIRREVGRGGPKNYFWEVHDKQGNVRWYGGYPDTGGPSGSPLRDGDGQPMTIDRSAIVYDERGNAVRWLLSAERDVGVNLIRYHYDTVQYADTRTGWQEDSSCDASENVCGRHTFLSRIDYTEGAQASGAPGDAAYQVHLLRQSHSSLGLPAADRTRSDPVVDASGGYVDVLVERLGRVEVRYGPREPDGSRTHDEVSVRYDLGYESSPFGKSLLHTVTQSGGTDETAVHTFDYHQEVLEDGSFTGFETSARTWDTGESSDIPTKVLLPSEPDVDVGALGYSESHSGEGHGYLGFNPGIPQKVGSFGASLQIGGGTTTSHAEWLDINGDSLPDKVFRQGNQVKYRLNTSGPSLPSGQSATFGEAQPVGNLTGLGSESSVEFQGALEAHFGVTAAFGLGAEVSWGDSYFTDVNGDGLPDFVSGGDTLFNRLEDGVPTFSSGSGGTFVPLPANSVTPDVNTDQLAEIQADLAEKSPLVDTVRRWTAPFTGTVTIDAPVTLEPVTGASVDGVRVAIQHNGEERHHGMLTSSGESTFLDPVEVKVDAGDRLYFRVGSVNNGANDEVTWAPVISYTAVDGEDVDDVPTDGNGLSQLVYSAAEDFTLSGRPETQVVLPFDGQVRFTAQITKTAATTDDLQLVLEHNGTAVPGSEITIDADFVGTKPVQVDFPVQGPTMPDPDDPGAAVPPPDTVHARLAVDSPIDLTAIDWQPALFYLSATGPSGDPVDVGTPAEPNVEISLAPEIDQYPQRSSTGVSRPWKPTSGSYDIVLDFTRSTDNPGGTAVLSVKDADGVVKQVDVDVPSGAGDHRFRAEDISLNEDNRYWLELTMRDPDLSDLVTLTKAALRPADESTDEHDVELYGLDENDVPKPDNVLVVRWSGRQGIFPLGYRGWALAGYTANGSLATESIKEDAFVIDTDALQARGKSEPSGFEDVEADPPAPDPSIAFLPVTEPIVLENQPEPFADPYWRGSRENIAGTGERMRSSRYGSDSVSIGASPGGSGRAVTRVSVTGPSASLAFGLGPLGGSFGVGPSFGLVDYEDMNGDGYPDVVTPGSVHYTTQRGTYRQSATSFSDGMDVTNQDLTFSVSGGLTSGLVDIKGNTKGKSNATQGSSDGKGGDANDSGGGMGIGVEVNASWTSPNDSGPSQSALVDDVPADPADEYGSEISQAMDSDPDTPISQELADVNGDGLPDRVTTDPEGVWVRYNLGYGFTPEARKLSVGGFEAMESYAGATSLGFSTPWAEFSGGVAMNWNADLARYTWSDVNGDGILDQVHKRGKGSSPVVAFGTGSGLLPPVDYGDMESSAPVFGVSTGPNASFDRSTGLGGGFDFTVYVGPLCIAACYLVINPGASYQNSVSSTEVDLQDVNGDGYADSVSTTEDSSLQVRLNTHGKTHLLASVENPLGGTIELDYQRDGNTVEHPDSVWTLDTVRVDDGRTGDGPDVLRTDFDYSGLKYDRVHRQSLGYAEIREHEVDAATGTAIRTTTRSFLNDNVFVAGLETGAIVTDAVTGENLRGATMEWGFRDARVAPADLHAPVDPVPASLLTGLTGVESLGRSIAPLLLASGEQFYDGPDVGQERTVRFRYDGLGNVVRQADQAEDDDPTDDLVAEIAYSTCLTSSSASLGCPDEPDDPAHASPLWSVNSCPTWVSLPASITVSNGRSGADRVVYRERSGATDLCDNSTPTRLEERIDESTVAVTELAYDAYGSYDRIVYPEGSDGSRYAVRYTYDADRNTDVAEVTEYDFDDAGATAFLEDGSVAGALRTGLTSSATYEPLSGRPASRTDANGTTVEYTYDAFGRITSIGSPLPEDNAPLVTFEYHPSASAYGYAVARHYDRFNAGDTIDTVSFVDGIGRVTQTKRDARLFTGSEQPAVDGRIVSGAVVYDELGREVEQYRPIADSTPLTTFEPGRSDQVTTTEYDLWDAPNVVTEPGDRVTQIAYEYADLDGVTVYATTTTDPRGRARTSWTDMHDRVLALDDQPEGESASRSRYHYNGMGELLSFTDSAGEVTTHAYDMLGRRTASTTPDGGLVEMGYDAEGKLVSRVTPNLRAAGQATTYAYELGNLVGIDHPGSTPDVSYTYGGPGAPGYGAGRVVRSEDGARIQELSYDAAGALVEQTAELKLHHWDPAGDTAPFRFTTQWTYDGLGRVGSLTYPDGEVVTYDYDAGGQVVSVLGEEEGYEEVVVGHDEEGNPITEQQPRTWQYPYVLDRQYDEYLQRRWTELGNEATTEWTFDADTRWLERVHTLSPNRNTSDPAYQEIQDLNYTYDVVGNPVSYANELPPPTPSLFGGPARHSYDYDPWDRLVSATGEWEQADKKLRHYEFALSYDKHGNVVSKEQTDAITNGKKDLVQKDTSYSFDRRYQETAPHQATSVGRDTYHYDANGNLLGLKDHRGRWIRRMEWDATDRMTLADDISNSTTYRYDDTGQLAIERGPNGETAFVNPWVTIRNRNEMFKHVWAGEDRVATQRDDGKIEEVKRYFLHKDLQGSTSVVSDALGDTFQRHEYFPTGEVWVDESSTVFRTPYQYGGSYVDERRDLSNFGARWYDPAREMMYAPDPVLVADPSAVVDQPGLRAAYGYAGANPVSNIDPSGLQFIFTQAQAERAKARDKVVRDTLAETPKMAAALADSMDSRLPRSFLRLGLDIKRADRLQKFADRFDAKPFVEIDLSAGTVKLSLGIGKRLKIGGDASPATGQDGGAAPATAPNATSSPPPAVGGNTAQAPAAPAAPPGKTQSVSARASGAGTASAGQANPPPTRPTKPLPTPPAKTTASGDPGTARSGQ
ncbi:SpvB/TcaC N-terminal domain-containing protein [Ornithinicoccus halotolerans]|uniref:SpvB/TcaC N-terminal domain-containing protein n=1 Tax=Ornithinicoccus halotolerans TaxID=1748220 RepID=UPI001295A072|nr:SpvB/TcaC N-terminal domain-containing protein [Ornithinicoccus halotolerans]